ncbi:hypothetical protein [Chelatococcus sambhunathii]|uniref:hypothetical protein n=1 Tax=Chelatococcus sambhunathii TaxID=363953 RepID=UPI0006E2DE81|nr:hypothetical protein [Chelatococcus sambhunathii]
MTKIALIVHPMLQAFRRLVILIAALAFSATSVGWGYANTPGQMPAAGGAVAETPRHAHVHHGHGQDADSDHGPAAGQACPATNDGSCKSERHQGAGMNCCAFACHLAIPSAVCTSSPHRIVGATEPAFFRVGIKEALAARLERPPRSGSAQASA